MTQSHIDDEIGAGPLGPSSGKNRREKVPETRKLPLQPEEQKTFTQHCENRYRPTRKHPRLVTSAGRETPQLCLSFPCLFWISRPFKLRDLGKTAGRHANIFSTLSQKKL